MAACFSAKGICALVAGVAAMLPATVSAQSVSARVLDAAGKPIAFAEVDVEDSAGQRRSMLTSPSGEFDAATMEPGANLETTRFTITAPGHIPVTVTGTDLVSQGLLVVLSGGAELSEILVIGRNISRAFAPESTDRLTLVTDPATRGDPLMAVEGLPFSTNLDGSADLELRGVRAGRNKVYFNDVPVYESVRGSDLDRSTRANSIFNSAVVGEVEIYPSHPPAYLAGSVGGAMRVLTDDIAAGGGTLFASTVALAADWTSVSQGGPEGYLQSFANVTDMSLALALNPGLGATLSDHNAIGGGVNAEAEIEGGTARLFVQMDREDGRYPLSLFSFSDEIESKRERASVIGSYLRRVGEFDVTTSFAATATGRAETFGILDLKGSNRYYFASIDAAGGFGRSLAFRVGIDAERIDLSASGQAPVSFFLYHPAAPSRTISSRDVVKETSAYAYVSWTVSERLALQAGLRHSFNSTIGSETGWQVGGALSSANRRHRILGSWGRYYSADLPGGPFDPGVRRVTSEQGSLDYRLDWNGRRSALSVFRSTVETAGETVSTTGAEASLSADLTSRLSMRWSWATVDQRVASPWTAGPGESDLDHYHRVSLRYRHSPDLMLGLYYASRDGARYTPVTGAAPLEGGWFQPVFDVPALSARLPRYDSLDLNLTYLLPRRIAGRAPVLFVAITNALDERNVRGFEFAKDYSESNKSYYPSRTVSAGMVIIF